jgi:hypothetical protein
MHRVLALVYAVPGIGWAVATLAVLLYHQERGELPMTPFGWRLLGGPYPQIGTDRLTPLGGPSRGSSSRSRLPTSSSAGGSGRAGLVAQHSPW